MRGRVALGALVIARLLAACGDDGVTPDCTTNPSVCNYIEGDAGPLPLKGVDAGKDARADATTTDAADSGATDAADDGG